MSGDPIANPTCSGCQIGSGAQWEPVQTVVHFGEVFDIMNLERITLDPAVMGGKPCIRGLRVTVGTLLGLMSTGVERERILAAYPYLEPEDLDAALAFAAWRLEEREEELSAACG